MGRIKKRPERRYFIGLMAERVGFEPTVPCGTPDFESGTFGHSATSPIRISLPDTSQAALTKASNYSREKSVPAHQWNKWLADNRPVAYNSPLLLIFCSF